MKIKRIVVLGLSLFGLMAGVAVATPGLLATPSTPVRGTIAEPFKVKVKGVIDLKTKDPIDVADQTITLQAGGHTGWHSHPGPVLVVIKSGTLTVYRADDPSCTPTVYPAGSSFIDPGGDNVHIARNEGTTPVELLATYLLPIGAGPRTDVVQAPGNCAF